MKRVLTYKARCGLLDKNPELYYKEKIVFDTPDERKTAYELATQSVVLLKKFQKQAVAEAKVLRAYNFFLLACYWGQPPLVDHLLAPDAIPTNSEMTQQEYFAWVAKQCEEALPDLIERSSTSDKEGSWRVTKGFANALAGKAYMFAGDFNNAKTALKRVVDSGR